MREVDIAGKKYVLNYRLSDREPIEDQLGKGLWEAMTSGLLKDQATIIWAGLRHNTKLKATPKGVIEMLEQHVEREVDGDYQPILRAAYWAVLEGKLLGSFNRAEMVRIWGDPDAQPETPNAVAAGQNV